MRKLGAGTKEGRLQAQVSKVLFIKGLRRFVVEIGIRYSDKVAGNEYFAIVSFPNGNKAPPEKIKFVDKAFLEYGLPNIHLPDEFVALCMLLQ